MPFSFSGQERLRVLCCPEETFSTTIAVVLLEELDTSPKSSDRLPCESSPSLLCSAVDQVDVLRGLGLCHMRNTRIGQVLRAIIG